MAVHGGPKIATSGLVLSLDAANSSKSTLSTVEVLVVAGGGGGGSFNGGGGGAGGLIYSSSYSITPGSAITVTVGAGGIGDGRPGNGATGASGAVGTNGGNSVFGSLTAIGGGVGATYSVRTSGVSGGSGGGSWGSLNFASGTAGQGNAGGGGYPIGNYYTETAGGGGGAGSSGVDGGTSSNQPGAGGLGLLFNISGSVQFYAAGGGAGANRLGGSALGGSGIGGNGGTTSSLAGVAGVSNTGSGGGGAAYNGFPGSSADGGAGGSGIVIVRYPGPQKATGGTVTSSGGYTIHTFTSVGSTTFTPLSASSGSAISGLTDISNNGNFGTPVNGPTYSSANGGSIVFDGVDDYVTTGRVIVPNSSSSYTVSVWCYRNINNVGYEELLSQWASANTGNSFFFGFNNSNVRFTDNWNDVTVPGAGNTGVWMNLVGVYSVSNAFIYLNGSLSATKGSGFSYTGISNFIIGRQGELSSEYFSGRISNTQIYNRAFSAAEVLQNYNATKSRYVRDGDGSSAGNAAPSASYLVSLGLTTDGVYWIDLPTVGPTQVYCILNPVYDGGGWMMAMKATTGTTFNYSANYWTTANTLNPTETNRNNGDAKFNSMNYFQSKDMMAIWPDISNGGSIPSSTLGWTWLQNNFNDGTRITPISFFGITYPTMNAGGSGKFIQDAKTFSGWASGVFSSQVDVRFYGFNYINNPQYGTQAKMRWGFGWNENGEGLYPSSFVSAYGSNDVSGGIGMDSGFGSYSAGDRINCCQDTTGINRSARVEVYVR